VGVAAGVGVPSAQYTNPRGPYSDAVLSELESQNDSQVFGLSSKVQRLKDVSFWRLSLLRPGWWLTGFAQLTLKIGDEIRGSTALAQSINDDFDSTSSRLKGTMNRMLRMAERTGIGWRVWAGFFAAVIFLFWYVWLF
jgi:blocked early in transport 1